MLRAFLASKPADIITLGLLVFVQLVIAAITTSPCFKSSIEPEIFDLSLLFLIAMPWPR